jgi:hypothetical protein
MAKVFYAARVRTDLMRIEHLDSRYRSVFQPTLNTTFLIHGI